MTKVFKAMLLAEKAHQGQTYGIFPYTYHLQQVLDIANELECDEPTKVACVLHDVLEDTSISYNQIKTHFGVDVADIVLAVTDEVGKTRRERKNYAKIKANHRAILVKVCDRIANIEASKVDNPELLEMYINENKDFVEALSDEACKNAFDLLEFSITHKTPIWV